MFYVRVKSVNVRSPAERAGFRVGDIIAKVADEKIRGYYGQREIMETLETSKIGSTIKFTVERREAQVVISLVIAAAPPGSK
jgi:S1-C subfamily serine protease